MIERIEVTITRRVKNYLCTILDKDCVGANGDGCPGWKIEYMRPEENKACKFQKIETLIFESLDEMKDRFPSSLITNEKGTVIR